MSVSIVGYWGKFDFCHPTEESYQLCVSTPYGNVSEHFKYEVEAGTVEEALDAIETRVKEYWISTSRDETLAKCAAIREHLNECEQTYLQSQISALEKNIEREQLSLRAMKSVLEDLINEKTVNEPK